SRRSRPPGSRARVAHARAGRELRRAGPAHARGDKGGHAPDAGSAGAAGSRRSDRLLLPEPGLPRGRAVVSREAETGLAGAVSRVREFVSWGRSFVGPVFRGAGLLRAFEPSQSNSLLVGGRMTPPGAPNQHLVVARHVEDAALELMQERDVLVAAAGRAGRVAQLEALFASHADGEATQRDWNP